MTLEEARAALVKAQLEEGKRYRIWKRQPNPTTYAAYKKASHATGDAVKLWADLRDAEEKTNV